MDEVDGRRARKAKSREAILEAASRLLSRQGIERTSVAEVTAAAGRTVGGFYGHWQSKEELFAEAFRARYRASRGHFLDRHAAASTAVQRGVGLLRAYLSRSHRDEGEAACPVPEVTPEVPRLGPELRAVFVEETDAFGDELGAKVPGGRAMALGIVALMYGGLSMARAAKGTPLSDEILKACREVGAWALAGREANTSENASENVSKSASKNARK